MLLSKKGLELHKITTEDDRYALQGIRIESDGSMIATDGHRLMRFTPKGVPPADDYPEVGHPGVTAESLEPFTMPADAAKTILKMAPKGRKHVPIIADYVSLDVPETNKNGVASIAWTDLEMKGGITPEKIQASFPKYEAVIPPKSDRPIGFDLKYMREVCDVLIRQGFGWGALSIQEDPPRNADGTYPDGSDSKPIRIDGVDHLHGPDSKDDDEAVAVIMPVHL